MNLDFSSILQKKVRPSSRNRLSNRQPIRGPMVPSLMQSTRNNSFKHQQRSPSYTNHNSHYLNNQHSLSKTRMSGIMIGEITKQSKEVLEQTVIKKPTAYYAMEGLGRGKQYAPRLEGRMKRRGDKNVQDSWDESLIMEFSDKLYNTSISRDTRTSFSVRHLINLEGSHEVLLFRNWDLLAGQALFLGSVWFWMKRE